MYITRGVAKGGLRGSEEPPFLGTLYAIADGHVTIVSKSHYSVTSAFSDLTSNNHPTFDM